MFFIGYFKGEPTEYILEYRRGRLVRHGPGLAFFYNTWTTSLSLVPLNTQDASFIFNETTGNFQAVAIQGSLTYRVMDPVKAATVLNFSVDPGTRRPLSNDPQKLAQRVVNTVQVHARGLLATMTLERALAGSEEIAGTVLDGVRKDPLVVAMGIEVIGIQITAIKPTPEMARALEAEYRESLQRRADEAVYARRAAAVEQERKISENELATKITLEERRRELVELEGENDQKMADFQSAALATRLKPYRDIDPRQLMAMGIRELGEKAASIQQLSLTPELLTAIRDAR